MEDNKSLYNLYYEWWKNIDKFIFSLIILLFVIGLFFSLVSTSLLVSDKLDTNDYAFFFKHLSFVLLGIMIIFVLSSIDQEKLFKISPIIFLFSLTFLFLVPIIGVEINSAQRWIDLYLIPRFQPIELVKPFLIVLISIILSSEKYTNIYLKYLFSFLITLIIALLLAAQPDIGQTLLVFFSWSVLIFISGINIIFLITSFLIFLITLYFSINFITKFAYIKNRLLSFFNTETGTHNAQSEKAIDSITSGGYFGKGLGEGTLKNRVPEAHTDYIISVISEEFGVIAIILILLLFLTFIYSVFKKVYLENVERNKLVLVGCISLILVQAMIHIGVNIRLFPTTGMTLPFISYGGSSIISISILSGIILNLTKRKIV
ncbi:FtsW/RodA/SpoVE family cell cycle protein [Pelagibacterales bacterium SAG-MED47]|nr:FtsW/RodA/SpoVE family cell cycle protein [Pelagibacterales bacterium SAG-MED47]